MSGDAGYLDLHGSETSKLYFDDIWLLHHFFHIWDASLFSALSNLPFITDASDAAIIRLSLLSHRTTPVVLRLLPILGPPSTTTWLVRGKADLPAYCTLLPQWLDEAPHPLAWQQV